MHALGPIRALRPRLQRLAASLVKRRTPIAAEPRDPPRDFALRPPRVFLSRQIPIAVARSRRPRPHLVAMAVPPAKAPSPKRVNGDKSPKASKAKAKAPRRTSPTEDIEDLIGKHPSLASVRDDAPRLKDELLAWYDKSHRILPWRRNFHSQHAPPPPGPRGDGAEPREYWAGCDTAGAPANVPLHQYAYGVWVSEVMSQQTQIERVAQYWLKWVERWPDVSALAAATREEVNESWAGLGYYRRAGFLLDGARHVVESNGASFPDDAEGLAHVPGVGPYTAAAVASIAFGEPVAAVDGNVIRVCTRLAAVTGGGDAAKPSSDAAKAVRLCADWLIGSSRPGDFNQAMMELGATVCTPKAPACGRCPLREGCAGAALELAGTRPGFKVTDLPEKEKKPEKREERVAVKVVERRPPGVAEGGVESSFLLVRRPEGGLLGGLWEFPSAIETTEPSDGEDFYAKCAAVVDACTAGGTAGGSSGTVRVSRVSPLGEVTHTFSHVRHTYVAQHEVWEVASDGDEKRSGGGTGGAREWRWVTATELETLGLSSGVRKIYELLTKREKAKKAPRESAIGKLFAKKAKRGE